MENPNPIPNPIPNPNPSPNPIPNPNQKPKKSKPRKKPKQKLKRKLKIPRALREQVWLKNFGKIYEKKCLIDWCQNIITVFDFHVGHNIPESKGGPTTIENLKPICARCNTSMSNNYSIQDWSKMGKDSATKSCCVCC